MPFWDRFPPYVTVAEKAARAERKRRQLEKKGHRLDPVCLQGRTIARSWWGKAWCQNLESYADYSNRIGRGRSYLRCGAVLDLKIEETTVTGLVQGSDSEPYRVVIRIAALARKAWQQIRSDCAGKIDSLQALLAGKFPEDLGKLFTVQKNGLFPSPAEIKFDCSCPDWASMCKHVAAVLYGVGARLDRSPELFFVLRGVSVDELVGGAVEATARKFIDQRPVEGTHVIAEDQLSDLFGINFAAGAPASTPAGGTPPTSTMPRAPESKRVRSKKTTPAQPTPRADAKRPKPRRGRPPKAVAEPDKTAAAQKRRPRGSTVEPPTGKDKAGRNRSNAGIKKPASAKRPPRTVDPVEQILKIVRASRKGIDVPAIQKRTGIDPVKIRNTIFTALRKGLIQRVSRGFYKGV
ncbi:MAG: hypothetical protein RBR20_03630 [Desulfobacterales bacterium]|jgi:uncharacterized Zn finger protein|nr:hypothetical protein [Desulfobacteraceae bacterium]MDD3992514.1 hypothetical protein [Desulfobacteraceae bacterium]MDY0311193.1 hypothetical protein [Desulfobacterales bacterium]